ncbi:MAG: alcohol dehydrogenase catalytic domain-containing protein, partial [Desulfatitalea sp.]|nr:alcohol dehydrogenase catalytic domain-containing protein [Desulfatitalea sp.]NNK01838.1 alcohol dehydrogenase catalytic domain-containing protein [Desulfatitalea sp.]
MKAIQVEAFGGPEVLTLKDVEIGEPASDQVLIKNHTIGVNFLDLYQRQGQKMGSFPLPLPMVPGVEGAGVVAAVGDGVE